VNAIAGDARRHFRLRTPEGVTIPFEVASASSRVAAFMLDFGLIVAATVAVWVAATVAAAAGLPQLSLPIAALAHFLLWNFYFVVLEARWSGATVGKRALGLRVIARDGGPLATEAVLARNLMRNLELNLPLVALLAPGSISPSAPGWTKLLAVGWILVFAFMPLFGKDRLRCGDMVAGTLVVKAPKAVLLPDLADRPPPAPASGERRRDEITFTREQLDIYGIHELQVLEDLLHRDNQGTLDGFVLEEVGEKIKRKIGWPEERWNVPLRPFLESFYRAQRAHLEQRMLFGQRRERKKGAASS
jgi:uncharacterized RDD family membrane protein YckC